MSDEKIEKLRRETFVYFQKRRSRREDSYALAKYSMAFFKQLVLYGKYKSINDLIRLLKEEGERLYNSYPTEFVIRNMLFVALKMVREEGRKIAFGLDEFYDPSESLNKLVNPTDIPADSEIIVDPKKLRQAVISSIDEIIGEIGDCRENLANQAGHHVLATDTVITYKFSKSPTLKEFFKQIRCCILSVDDDPADENITANVIESVEILSRIRSATRVVLSAAAILPDGSCITPAGTLAICLAAKRHSVPVLVCAAFYKLTPLFVPNLDEINVHGSPTEVLPFAEAFKYPSVFISNPLFDLIPAQFVSLYVTHTSAVSPSHVYRLIADYYHPDDFYHID